MELTLRLGFIAGLLGLLVSIAVPATVAVVLLFFTLGLVLVTIAASQFMALRRERKR